MDGGELSRAVVAEQPMDCCFHPSCNLLAAGVITGQVQVFRYEGDQTTAAFDVKAHNESCRSVRFTQSGELLLSASADCSILATDTATGQPAARLEDAHPDGINRLECIDSATLASGDDEGLVKLWDIRQQKAIATLEAHSDFVSDFFYSQELNSLVATSGDGTISVTDLRRNKVVAQSEDDADDELLSVVVLKNGKKVVSGSQEGVLFLYSWGYWNDCSDRFPGHPNSIDTIVKFDEDTIITGSSDGIVRILNILPNKLLGVVGEHAEMPIERIALSGDRKLLASASHDKTIKIWDIKFLQEQDGSAKGETEEVDMEEEVEEAEELVAEPPSSDNGKAPAVPDAEEEEEDSDMDDSDDDMKQKNQKPEKTRMKGRGKGKGKANHKSNFFSGML